MVASKAISVVFPLAGRDIIYRPRLRSVRVRERRPADFRVNLSNGVSILRGAKVSPAFTCCPPSHQLALLDAKTSCWVGSGEPGSPSFSSESLITDFFFPRQNALVFRLLANHPQRFDRLIVQSAPEVVQPLLLLDKRVHV